MKRVTSFFMVAILGLSLCQNPVFGATQPEEIAAPAEGIAAPAEGIAAQSEAIAVQPEGVITELDGDLSVSSDDTAEAEISGGTTSAVATLDIDGSVREITSAKPDDQINALLCNYKEDYNNVTLTLLKNMTLSTQINICSDSHTIQNLTIDLNGKILSGNFADPDYHRVGVLIYLDNSVQVPLIKNGKIRNKNKYGGCLEAGSDSFAAEDVTFDGKTTSIVAKDVDYDSPNYMSEWGELDAFSLKNCTVKGNVEIDAGHVSIEDSNISANLWTTIGATNVVITDSKFTAKSKESTALWISAYDSIQLNGVTASGVRRGCFLNLFDDCNSSVAGSSFSNSSSSDVNGCAMDVEICGAKISQAPSFLVESGSFIGKGKTPGLRLICSLDDSKGGSRVLQATLRGGKYSSIEPIRQVGFGTNRNHKDINPSSLIPEDYGFFDEYAVQIISSNEPLVTPKPFFIEPIDHDFSITYDDDGGTYSGTPRATSYSPTKKMKKISLPSGKNMKRTGYKFLWWMETGSGSIARNITYKDRGNKNFKAIWLKIPYKITYKVNRGKMPEHLPDSTDTVPSYYYTESGVPVLPVPTRNGYIFGGWYYDKSFTKLCTSIPVGTAGKITLYAKWSPIAGLGEDFDPRAVYDGPQSPIPGDTNPDNKMAPNLYLNPTLPAGDRIYSAFSIDFRIPEVSQATYWSLCNGTVGYSQIEGFPDYERLYTTGETATIDGHENVEIFRNHGGIYGGVQYGENDSNPRRFMIGSMWDTDYMNKSGERVHLEAELLEGVDVYGVKHVYNEGSAARCIRSYEWKEKRWYRYVEKVYDASVNGQMRTIRDNWIQDKTTGQWTLIARYNTGRVDAGLEGGLSQFVENFSGAYASEMRSVQWSNIYVMKKGTTEWIPITSATLSTQAPKYSGNKKGSFTFGAEDYYFWGVSCGIGPIIYESEPDKAYSVTKTIHNFDGPPDLSKLSQLR